jgi:cell division transport system permease protein
MADRQQPVRPGLLQRTSAWLGHHAQSMVFSLGKLYRAPASTLMTIAVIGITLTLPAGFYLFMKNIENLSGDLRSTTRISLFLKLDISERSAEELNRRLRQRADIADSQLIPRDQALQEFRASSGLGDSIDLLDDNPLPHTLLVQPDGQLDRIAIGRLLKELGQQPEVELAQLDTEWLERLYTLLEIARRAVIIISLLFSFAVLLIVGNTIRLDIQSRHQEIVVTKLIGATDAFIRRPFLYSGVWYGLFGGLLAWIIVELSAMAVSGPWQRLGLLYRSDLSLVTFSAGDFMILIGTSTALGLIGSWLAVARHLSEIEPQ